MNECVVGVIEKFEEIQIPSINKANKVLIRIRVLKSTNRRTLKVVFVECENEFYGKAKKIKGANAKLLFVRYEKTKEKVINGRVQISLIPINMARAYSKHFRIIDELLMKNDKN